MDDERYEAGRRVLERMLGEGAEGAVRQLRAVDPEFERLVMTFVMGDLYARPGLDLRTRLLCTIAALTVAGRQAQLKAHVARALGVGATRAEIVEVILQMSAFGGFPAAWDALLSAREAFDEAKASGGAEASGGPEGDRGPRP